MYLQERICSLYQFHGHFKSILRCFIRLCVVFLSAYFNFLIIEVDGCMLHYRLLSPATEASSSADGFDQMVAAWEEARERKW